MTQHEALLLARSVFYGFGAWVGRLDGPTACAFWPDDPNNLGFDPARLIAVDLAKNPAAHLAGSITRAQIQVDDAPARGGMTKIGPTWPTGATIGGVWLEAQFYGQLANKPVFPQPFINGRGYELTTAVDWGSGAPSIARRYWGLHCKITGEQGTLALCTLWTPGTSRTQPPAGTWWIDLATQADPIANGLTTVGVGGAQKEGALFLSADTVRNLAIAGPKLPPYLGASPIPAQPTLHTPQAGEVNS
jgi:hypothetical protein